MHSLAYLFYRVFPTYRDMSCLSDTDKGYCPDKSLANNLESRTANQTMEQ